MPVIQSTSADIISPTRDLRIAKPRRNKKKGIETKRRHQRQALPETTSWLVGFFPIMRLLRPPLDLGRSRLLRVGGICDRRQPSTHSHWPISVSIHTLFSIFYFFVKGSLELQQRSRVSRVNESLGTESRCGIVDAINISDEHWGLFFAITSYLFPPSIRLCICSYLPISLRHLHISSTFPSSLITSP